MELFPKPSLTSLSQELLCQVLSYLPVKDILTIGMMCKKLRMSVQMHLRLCKRLDLCDSEVWGSMPEFVTDDQIYSLLKKCPKLEALHGLHPQKVERRRLRSKTALSIPGIIDALLLCHCLQKVETNNLQVLEALSQYFPQIQVVGHFRNVGGSFPPDATQQLKLNRYPLITSLHLVGVYVPELGYMPELKDLHLQWVRFTKFSPFKSFKAPKLTTFVMKQCLGPDIIRYMHLLMALSHALELTRLEFIRLPFPPIMFQRLVERSWQHGGFQKLKKLVIYDCRDLLATDIGYLMIVASRTLECITLSPAVTSDSFFASLEFAGCDFASLRTLNIGYAENLWPKGDTAYYFSEFFDNVDPAPAIHQLSPSAITDRGVQIIGRLFPNCTSLTLSHCPHIIYADTWISEGNHLENLEQLTLRQCPCLKVETFSKLIPKLKSIEVMILKDMFREPPKGCSHVGLSVGTGLGLSSAIVTTRDERVAFHIPDGPFQFRIDPELDLQHMHNNGEEFEHHQPVNHENDPVPRIKVEPEDMPVQAEEIDLSVEYDRDDKGDLNLEIPRENLGAEREDVVHEQQPERKVVVKEERFCPDYPEAPSVVPALPVKKEFPDSLDCPPSTSKIRTVRRMKKLHTGQSYKGPLTRNRKRMMLAKQPFDSNRCSQGTQTCSSFIRRNLGQQICCCSLCNMNCKCCYANNSAKENAPNKKNAPRKPETCDKSTSTNDPLLEDDVEQILFIDSETLKSLTVVSCGISSLYLEHTPDLVHMKIQSCRILKDVYFRYSPCICRVSISQCPKYNILSFLTDFSNISLYKPFVVYLRPCFTTRHSGDNVETFCSNPRLKLSELSYAIVYDFSFEEDDRGVFRENLLRWLRLLKQIIEDSTTSKKVRKTNCDDANLHRNRWQQHRIFGEFSDGSHYELLTNNLLLATLWRRNKNSIEICPRDESSGFYNVTEVRRSLQEEIAELKQLGYVGSNKYAGFYITV